MQINIKKIFLLLTMVVSSVLIVSVMVNAATNLLAPAAPNLEVGTMKTLEDIYQRLTAGTVASSHTLNPILGPTTGTMHTLSIIYDAIPTNSEVCSGTNAGTATCAPTEWSDVIGGSSDWAAANAFCENPANGYTRLPTTGELAKAMTQQLLETGPQGFNVSNYYWSDDEVNGYITSNDFSMNSTMLTAVARCVR